jgi:hypothetical protein
MSTTSPVRTAVKTMLENDLVQPVLPAGTLTVYAYPEDGSDEIKITTFPTIVVKKGVYDESDSWRRVTQSILHFPWWLEIIVFLSKSKLPDWQAQQLSEDWEHALATLLIQQPTLNGTIAHIIQGEGGEFLYFREGFWDWYTEDTRNPDSYWGVGVRMQVVQSYDYAETVGVNN